MVGDWDVVAEEPHDNDPWAVAAETPTGSPGSRTRGRGLSAFTSNTVEHARRAIERGVPESEVFRKMTELGQTVQTGDGLVDAFAGIPHQAPGRAISRGKTQAPQRLDVGNNPHGANYWRAVDEQSMHGSQTDGLSAGERVMHWLDSSMESTAGGGLRALSEAPMVPVVNALRAALGDDQADTLLSSVGLEHGGVVGQFGKKLTDAGMEDAAIGDTGGHRTNTDSLMSFFNDIKSDPRAAAIYQGGNLIKSALPMALAVAARSPTLGGLMSGTSQYGQDRDAGIDPLNAQMDMAMNTAMERGGEELAFDELFGPGGKNAAINFLRRTGTEGAQELFTGGGQEGSSEYFAGQEFDPEKIKQAAIDSGLAGVAMGTGMAAPGVVTDLASAPANTPAVDAKLQNNDTRINDLIGELLGAPVPGGQWAPRSQAPIPAAKPRVRVNADGTIPSQEPAGAPESAPAQGPDQGSGQPEIATPATAPTAQAHPQLADALAMSEDDYIAKVSTPGKRLTEEDVQQLNAIGDIEVPATAKPFTTAADKSGDQVELLRDSDGTIYATKGGKTLGYIGDQDGETVNYVVPDAQGSGVGTLLAKEYIRTNPFAPAGALSDAGEKTRRAAHRALKAEAAAVAAPTITDPLAPRAPQLPTLDAGTTREQLVAEHAAAQTDNQRSTAAARIAAFDEQEKQRGKAENQKGPGQEGRQVREDQGRPGDAGQAQAVEQGQTVASRTTSPLAAAVRTALGPAAEGVNVLSSIRDVPADVAARNQVDRPENQGVEGFYDRETGQAYVIEQNLAVNDKDTGRMSAPARAVWVAAHEQAGHAGLRGMFVAKAGGNHAAGMRAFHQTLEASINNPTVQAIAEKTSASYAAEGISHNMNQMREEAFAELAAATRTGNYDAIETRYGVKVPQAQRDTIRGQVARLVAQIKAWFRENTGQSFTDAQVHALIEGAWKQAKSGKSNASKATAAAAEPVISARAPLTKSRTTSALLRNLTPSEQAKITDKVAEKIVALMETMPSTAEMAAIAVAGQAKRGWYAQSAKTISEVFGPDGPRFALLLAATSPQTSVESNLRNTLNIWKNWIAAGRPTDRYDVIKIMGQSVEGSRGEDSVLDAWINNSVRALSGLPLETILSGPKVNSFYQNLIGNVEEVTNDAWMANFSLVDQTLFKGGINKAGTDPGKSAGYLAMSAKVRDAARMLTKLTSETWTPAEVQETIWSWAKTITEMAQDKGEIRTPEELLNDGAVTDELIASTPDFGTLFQAPEYRSILEEAGYGDEINRLAVEPAAGAVGEEPAARGKASAFAEEAQRKHERNAARRIKQLLLQRLDAKKSRADSAVEPDDDYIPFSRVAKNVYGPVQGTDLEGLAKRADIDGVKHEFHGFAPAQEIAKRFADKHGNSLPSAYVPVNPAFAARVAEAYDEMKHDPENVWVKRAYAAMIDETLEQYRAILDTGLVVEFITGDDPYATTPRKAVLDVVQNNHLWVFPTESGFGAEGDDVSGNPLLAPTEFEISGKPALANDIFRVVHDYFGHVANGVGFRADGEDNAWREHASMYSKLAASALTSETRGQNSWVNFGPHAAHNKTATGATTKYAEQKTGLMPAWTMTDSAPAAKKATVNIGLDISDGSKLTTEEAIASLESKGVRVTSHTVKQSNTEQTLVAEITPALTAEQAHEVSQELRQEAIAQRDADGVGEIYGPQAESWRPFNHDYFLDSDSPIASRAPQTAAFKKWFGDSKVVDENGDPLRVFHGTDANFDEFNVPAMFSTKKDYAKNVGNNVMEAYLNITNPADLRALHLSPSDPNFAEIAKRLQSEGYDGAQYRDEAYIAFSPEQIIPADDSILASRAPQTAAFKKWFGDSKVVDANGDPLVVYHGSDSSFDAFDMSEARDGAHWFVADESHAASFGNQRPFYVAMSNPMEISQHDLEKAWDAEYGELDEDGLDDVYDLPRDFVGQFVEQAKAVGHDGLIIRMMGDRDIEADMFLPFTPNQIKSATDNNGNYSLDDDSIIASRPFNAKPIQPDAIAVEAIHYSNKPNLKSLDPKMSGTGRIGATQRRRFGQGQYGKGGGTAARAYFFVRDGSQLPSSEGVIVGSYPYQVRLTNLYDQDADPRGFAADAGSNVDLMEENISEAGFDGLYSSHIGDGSKGAVAIVFDIGSKKIPVEPADSVIASRRPMFSEESYAAHRQAYEQPEYQALERAWQESMRREDAVAAKQLELSWAAAEGASIEKMLGKEAPRGMKVQMLDAMGKSIYKTPEYRAANAERQAAEAAMQDFPGQWVRDNFPPESGFLDEANQERAYYDSPAFKKWFGDSKVVSETGNPLVVFHGSPKAFSRFELPDRTARRGNPEYTGQLGMWFAARVEGSYYDPGTAEGVASDFAQNLRDEEAGVVYPVHLAIQNPMEFDGWDDLAEYRDGFKNVPAMRDALIAAGHDGVVIRGSMTDSHGHRDDWVAFRPNQIKSAIGNSGEFDANDDSIVAARPGVQSILNARARVQAAINAVAAQGVQQGTPSQPTPAGPIMAIADAVRTVVQDKMLPLLRTQEQTANLADMLDAYTLENLMHGKAKDDLETADRDFILKTQNMMKRTGLTVDQLQDYLLARHAPERNAKVASINPAMPDSGSGLSTADARAVLAGSAPGPYSGKPLSPATLQHAAAVAAVLDAMRTHTLNLLESSGQVTPTLARQLRAAYQHYVPLRGDNSETWMQRVAGIGKGLSSKKPKIKRALGRGEGNLGKNILGEMVGDLQRAIAQARKAEVTQAFLRFAIANPMPDLYTVEPVDLEWKFSESTGEAYLGVKAADVDADRAILVPHNGSTVRIRFEDEALRNAMMNMGAEDLGALVKWWGMINRWRSAVLTRFNPAFAPVNIIRDFLFGMTAISSEKGAGMAAKSALNYGPATAALWRDAGAGRRGDSSVPDASKTMDDWAREYAEQGAKTGLTQVEEVTDLQKRLSVGASTLIQLAAQGKPFTVAKESIVRALEPLAHTIERVNDATENALRLSIYVAERKAGRSKQEAAEYAKNVTINFNRRGQIGPALNAIYLFFNASMQGTHAVLRVMKDPRVSAMLVGLGGLQAMLAAAMMHDDDDDGITDWDMVPDYVKRTSLVIPLGALTGNGKDYFALPMPYGFNLFTYSGGRTTQWLKQGARITDNSLVMDMVKSTTEAFSPVPLFDGYNALFGDTMGALLQLAANKDDLGRPIVQENEFAPYPIPAALQGKPDTPRAYQALSQLMARVGGGDLEKRIPPVGFLDVAPEQLEYIAQFLGGGLANIVSKSTRWWEQMDAKNMERPMDYVTAAPIASRLLGTANESRAVAERYYGEAGEFARQMDLMKSKLRQGGDAQKIIDETGKEVPALRGVEIDRYKHDNKKTGKKEGDPKMNKDGTPKLKPGQGSVFGELKGAAKMVEMENGMIRDLRNPSLTNQQAVKIMAQNGASADDLGLPAGYTAGATAPNRVRQRAIKLIQEMRQGDEKSFLKATKEARKK